MLMFAGFVKPFVASTKPSVNDMASQRSDASKRPASLRISVARSNSVGIFKSWSRSPFESFLHVLSDSRASSLIAATRVATNE
jgi:hypothetical protein